MCSALLIVVTQQFSLLEVQFLDDSRAILGNSFSRPTINIYYNCCNLENKKNTRIHLTVAFQLCEVQKQTIQKPQAMFWKMLHRVWFNVVSSNTPHTLTSLKCWVPFGWGTMGQRDDAWWSSPMLLLLLCVCLWRPDPFCHLDLFGSNLACLSRVESRRWDGQFMSCCGLCTFS